MGSKEAADINSCELSSVKTMLNVIMKNLQSNNNNKGDAHTSNLNNGGPSNNFNFESNYRMMMMMHETTKAMAV